MGIDGRLSFDPQVAPLTAISPSRFSSVQECALREVWHLNKVQGLLPPSPASRLGSVIHSLLEQAGAGKVRPEAIDGRWDELIVAAESRMRKNWLERHNVPLRQSVPKYEVRRLQTRSRALNLIASQGPASTAPKTDGTPRLGYEFLVSSPDKAVIGRIDAVLPGPDGAVVQDYKSGQVFVDSIAGGRVIKEAIETQLRMYAALYASTVGSWPARLEVVPLRGAVHTVDFDRDKALGLVDSARQFLKFANAKIASARGDRERLEGDLATPSHSSCKYCEYRPGCGEYAKAATVTDSNWPADVRGNVVEIAALANSSLGVTINTELGTMRIRGITSRTERHPALAYLSKGGSLAAFNLARTASPSVFAESGATVIYLS